MGVCFLPAEMSLGLSSGWPSLNSSCWRFKVFNGHVVLSKEKKNYWSTGNKRRMFLCLYKSFQIFFLTLVNSLVLSCIEKEIEPSQCYI